MDPQTFEIEFQADKVNQADPANPSRAVIQFRAQLIQPGNCLSHRTIFHKLFFFSIRNLHIEGYIGFAHLVLIGCRVYFPLAKENLTFKIASLTKIGFQIRLLV